MRNILEQLEKNEVNDKDKLALAEMLGEFKKTEIYKIILRLNENEKKRLLSIDKKDGAERILGKLEGIQDAFENRIECALRDAVMILQRKKAMKEMKGDDDGEDGDDKKGPAQAGGL